MSKGLISVKMGNSFPENNKKLKEWIKPDIKKLSLSDTESGAVNTRYERARTDVYGGS